MNSPKHVTILYAVSFAALILAVLLLVTPGKGLSGRVVQENSEGSWVCIQQICSASAPGGDLWAQQNCGTFNQSGTLIEACRVVINNQEQIIAKSELNLSAIQMCTQYSCVQEAWIRNVSYPLNVT